MWRHGLGRVILGGSRKGRHIMGATSSSVWVRKGSVWENDSREKGRDRL